MPAKRSKTPKRKTTKRKTTRRAGTKSATGKTMKRKSTAKRKTTPKRKTTRKPSAKKKSPKTTARKKKMKKATSPSRSMSGQSNACITGKFDGEIVSPGRLHIAPNSQCNGNVRAASVEVDGTFKGNVFAMKQMKLGKKCKVTGNIVTDTFVAADGAAFEGYCKIGRRKAA